jgi:hypothetical protein
MPYALCLMPYALCLMPYALGGFFRKKELDRWLLITH